MKTIAVFLSLCGVSLLCNAEQIPDTTKLDAEKYTIQFALVELDPNFNQPTNYYRHVSDGQTLDDIQKMTDPLERIKNSNSKYTDFSVAHCELGNKFVSENGLVSGNVVLDEGPSGKLSFRLKYDDKNIELNDFPVKLNDWSYFGLGNGEELTHFMLIKLYPPKK